MARSRPLLASRLAPPLAALLLGACAALGPPPVAGSPVAGGGSRYAVGKLLLELPPGWTARGDDRRLSAGDARGLGRVEVQRAEPPYRGEEECLARAEDALQRGAASATNVRLHPTTFAGRKGVALEADQGPWHGWAWGVCDGAVQYRISFFGATPLDPEVLAAFRALSQGARFEP
ncbi:MAG: hypothetical protein HZB56_05015 [Deltaproteobacteria bacterium]|nr:hypothetical protein [Deltaproteobacteria bacterium]